MFFVHRLHENLSLLGKLNTNKQRKPNKGNQTKETIIEERILQR